jgi:multiple antibiotic resistance protein
MSLELSSALSWQSQAPFSRPAGYVVGAGEIFTLFFVTLGPLKLLGPYAKLTRGLDRTSRRQLALRAIVIAALAALAGGFLGTRLLISWHIPTVVALLAGGLVLLLVALRLVLEQYAPPPAEPAGAQAPPPSPFLIAFPGIVTPYGMAVVIVLLAGSLDAPRTLLILEMLAVVLALDLLAMWFAPVIVRTSGWLLQILGAVLGVMQIALAIRFILFALQHLGLLPGLSD